MDTLVKELAALIPGIDIVPGQMLRWSPKQKQISCPPLDDNPHKVWGLLHEAGHARLGHTSYDSDTELLLLEIAAWEEAQILAREIDHHIDSDHIQDCLDTYRDWLHQRSTCPRCGIVSFQETTASYRCYNCHKVWTVSASRLCRPYRLSGQKKNHPENIPETVFQ